MILKQAKDIAIEKCRLLQPYCDIIKIAGGIRRGKADVHDIELCVLPKTEMIKVDLFGNEKEVRSIDFVNVVNKLGKVVKGNAEGKMMQIELPEKIMLDLFIPDDFDFYRIFAIRTGSRDYSQKVLATGWNRIGWVGSDKGLRKQSDCEGTKQPDGKMKWKCVNPLAELPPVWTSEKHFFEWLKVKYLKPEQRNF